MAAVAASGKPASPGAGFLCASDLCARSWRILAALLAIASSGPACAQVDDGSDYLQRMDTDMDGRVSLAEYQRWMGYAFERMDLDRNDVLDPAELPGGRGRPVTLAQHRQSLAEAFRRQDLDHDGLLDARELAAPPQ